MCGICGFIKKGGAAKVSSLAAMNNAIRHRGPDDEGYFCIQDENAESFAGADTIPEIRNRLPYINPESKIAAGLGFRRLSILDLSAAGHQPMLSADGKIALTFNGQIYNYQAIRSELQQLGHHFHSQTDTEVILRGYEQWGKDVVHKLNGMFAFAIADTGQQTVWLVRDRIGIKPLFYHIGENSFTWASEIKAILKAPWVQAQLNETGLTGNYYLQTSPSPLTCFQNIFGLTPATWIEINLRTLERKEEVYWHLPTAGPQRISLPDAAAELGSRLSATVAAQMHADVPVITMMSGGVDSTTITALAHQHDPSISCYSFGIDGSGAGMDEVPQAVVMARKLGIRQEVHMVDMDAFIAGMDADLRHYEEPYTAPEVMLSPSQYLGERGYKVLLSGNGADEVFGGYSHFLAVAQWLKHRRWRAVAPLIPAGGNFLKKVKNYLKVDTGFKYYANSRSCMRPYQIEDLFLKQPGFGQLASFLPQDEHRYSNVYEALFHFEMRYSVGSHHVFRDDLSAMRYSVEMRYPYLDHTLVEWVASLPLALRYNGNITKPLLRATAAAYIDDINLGMPKKGFNLPLEHWWKHKGPVRAYMERQLQLLKKRGIFNNHTIAQWEAGSHTSFELSKIWQLITTEVWLQTYID
jgi:asparagine synthase (glutamine-hydrolysing)